MSKTPRTDAQCEQACCFERPLDMIVNADFARQLETELATVQASHDNQVKLRRALMDRPDLKERAALVERLAAELATKTAELEEAKRQMDSWLKEHDSMIRAARANSFD